MKTVVIGIVDDGIAFAHERFRVTGNRTRVAYAWAQAVPSGGLVLDQNQINGYIAASTHAGILDEDEFYRRSGWIDYRRPEHRAAAWRVSHGTHVMDLACGYPPHENRKDRPIICVQLPPQITADTSQALRSTYPIEAMNFILRRADDLAKRAGVPHLPVVINFSYGAIAGGPHDGTSLLERQMNQLLSQRKDLQIALPAGNSYLTRCHAEHSFRKIGETQCLRWRVPPDNRAQSFLEIWMPCRRAGVGGSRLEVRVTSPIGESRTVGEVPGQPQQWGSASGVYARLQYGVPIPGGRRVFVLALQPTAALDPAMPTAPSGVWTIELTNQKLVPEEKVHAWIERGDTPPGYPLRGRQSYFDEPRFERYDHGGRPVEVDQAECVVTRASLINSIGTGSRTIVMGGLLRKEMLAADYSAGGPIQAPCGSSEIDRYRPDAILVSDDSKVHRGVLAAGSRSGSTVALNGTSVAAPQIVRWITDRLAGDLSADRAAVQELAADQEAANPGRPAIPTTPPQRERYGAGRIALEPSSDSILHPVPPRPRFVAH